MPVDPPFICPHPCRPKLPLTTAASAKAVLLFDLDGTLIDDGRVTGPAVQEALDELDLPGTPPVERFRALSGIALLRILRLLDLPPELQPPYVQAMTRLIVQGAAVTFRGMEVVLRAQHERGLPVAVVTNKDRRRSRMALQATGLAPWVDVLLTPSETAQKPGPDMLLAACARLGIAPDRAVMIGDSTTDLRSARAAGIDTIACIWGAGTRRDLAAEQPRWLVEQPAALAALLGRITVPAAHGQRSLLLPGGHA
ncbi:MULTISPECIES: HAD family hydrolase [Actinosynnema]|uniref:HAD family hydrolase n=1 Tax=Actinosynnema TaxID=40566 RepID=UPI0020A44FA2|nr:HAD family hydrolase [Actinosynnema pretiosum]MCP2097440.1 phosphoglycolate phosphatase [Actinosynnema pretiosum]